MNEKTPASRLPYETHPDYLPCNEMDVKKTTDMIDDLLHSGLNGFGELQESSSDKGELVIVWSLAYVDVPSSAQHILVPESHLTLAYAVSAGHPSTESYTIVATHPLDTDPEAPQATATYTIVYYGKEQSSFQATAHYNDPLGIDQVHTEPHAMTMYDNYALLDELIAVDELNKTES